jgi:hypothetical protein
MVTAQIPYMMGLRPSHETWQFVDDPTHPLAFTSAEAAQRLPRAAWQRTVGYDSHGKELVVRSDRNCSDIRLAVPVLATGRRSARTCRGQLVW